MGREIIYLLLVARTTGAEGCCCCCCFRSCCVFVVYSAIFATRRDDQTTTAKTAWEHHAPQFSALTSSMPNWPLTFGCTHLHIKKGISTGPRRFERYTKNVQRTPKKAARKLGSHWKFEKKPRTREKKIPYKIQTAVLPSQMCFEFWQINIADFVLFSL